MLAALNRHLLFRAIPLLGLALVSCEGFRVPALEKLKAAENAGTATPAQPPAGDTAPGTDTSSVDLGFLLSMNYDEAKALAGNGMDLGTNGRVAAENIEVVKEDKEGQPRKVRAKGKVYLEAGSGDSAKILCQEAYINGDEAVLRGRPILQRGGTIIEGLADDTVFYFLGSRLRVIGLHRVTNPNTMLAGMPDLGPWTAGPNPLLPALSETAVPVNIREEMLKAATAEAVLQQNKHEALQQAEGAPAPWVKPGT
ncbi:hypothetical protein SAMN02745166_01783 [Prosthecobacter debontii]|uniref:Uncharacterized protein n=1 Tax=Prosthecobacter debontii TaxID=48467 RepID=A0A1T4XQC0_9BACT|nr:hypothetical protein [Prosthecobacter debontii]SKA91759.1 hypothetical protein SAMN02745166_01783 [Prosthecobacter debontii]